MPSRRALIALIVLAIAARASAVLVLQSHRVPHSTYEHGEIAANLLDGRGFSVLFLGADGPTSQQAPAYPVLVAAAYALGGVGTPRSLLILELGQSVLGGLMVGLVAMLAAEAVRGWPRIRDISTPIPRPIHPPPQPSPTRGEGARAETSDVFSGPLPPCGGGLGWGASPHHQSVWNDRASRVAILAALIAALHPTLVYAATHVQVASLAATLLVACLAFAYRAGRTGLARDALAGGISLGLLALADPILALVAPGMAWAIARGQGRRSARLVAIVGATAGLCVLPWVVRNARVHGEFVPIKSSFGYAFWQGNCSLSEGTDKVVRPSVDRILDRASGNLRDLNAALWEARHEAGYLDDIALTREDYRQLGAVSEPERSRILFRRALADLRADPGRYPRLCFRRLRYFVLFDETNPKTRSLVYRASHLGLTVLAALGLLIATPDARRRLAPTIVTAALIATFHALTIVSARFHLPIEPLMGLWAASAATRWGSSADQGLALDPPKPSTPAQSLS